MPARSDLAVDEAIDACVAGWGDRAARMRAAKQLGLVIDDTVASMITKWLEISNEKRRLYTLPLADVIRALVTASDEGIAVRHGGKGGKFAQTPSTVVLAVKSDDRIVVGIGTAPARGPTPGVVWKELAPWQQNMERNASKARAWAVSPDRALQIPLVARAMPEVRQSRVTRDAVLAQVLARPLDDEPRLVYADALTQRGDPRGEFIVIQCSGDPKLARREKELLRAHGAAWMKDAKQLARKCTMRRGFVASVEMTGRQFAAAHALFAKEPIEEVVIVASRANYSPNVGDLAVVGGSPLLERVDRLVVDGRVWIGTDKDLRAFQTFVRYGHLKVRSLHVEIVFGSEVDATIHTIFDGVSWPTVEDLELCAYGAGHIGRRGVPLVSDPWTCEQVWASLARASIPKLKRLAIAPYGNLEALRAAFRGAQIEQLKTRPRSL